eukprot:30474-Pelagococcus_subviridis.AAC.3
MGSSLTRLRELVHQRADAVAVADRRVRVRERGDRVAQVPRMRHERFRQRRRRRHRLPRRRSDRDDAFRDAFFPALFLLSHQPRRALHSHLRARAVHRPPISPGVLPGEDALVVAGRDERAEGVANLRVLLRRLRHGLPTRRHDDDGSLQGHVGVEFIGVSWR